MNARSPAIYRPYIWLSAGWILLALIVNPLGNFPLNDDWSYAKNVYFLSEENRLKFDDWPAMTLFTQMLWGAGLSKVFGFSFTVLRLGNLLLGLLGILVLFRFLKRQTGDVNLSLVGASLIGLNPLYFSLSFSFMTEVPFLLLCLLAVWNYWIFFESSRPYHLFIATAWAVAAILLRQTGIGIPLAFMLVCLWSCKGQWRRAGWALCSFILSISALLGYMYWSKSAGHQSTNFSDSDTFLFWLMRWDVMAKLVDRSAQLTFYLGFFLLPLTLSLWTDNWNNTGSKPRKSALYLATALTIYVVVLNPVLPVGNLINNFSLGPWLLRDVDVAQNAPHALSSLTWLMLKMLGFLGIFLLIFTLACQYKRRKTDIDKLDSSNFLNRFGLLTALGYSLFLIPGRFFFDRYFLFLVPFMLFAILPAGKLLLSRTQVSLALLSLILMGWYSIAGTHDYLAWNRARWEALQALEQEGISPADIDGGFEYNGWHGIGELKFNDPEGKSWWWIKNDSISVAARPIPCQELRRIIEYPSWLLARKDSLFIVQKAHREQQVSVYCDAEVLNARDSTLLATNMPGLYCSGGLSRVDTLAHSGHYSLALGKSAEFGFTMVLEDPKPCELLQLSVWHKSLSPQGEIGLVANLNNADKFYRQNRSVFKNTAWQRLDFEISLPAELEAGAFLKIYIWNNSGQTVHVDDLSIVRRW